jgi:ADP-ribose pyrophosphatase YjhB (NUDIX family)
MATTFSSTEFVESCGAIVFSSSKDKVCLVGRTHNNKQEWLLPKGRRNCEESRKQAALREVLEETGYECELQPVAMPTRAPADSEPADVKDEARTYQNLTEPFMLSLRHKSEKDIKLIYWFIAVAKAQNSDCEAQFSPKFFTFDDALATITFSDDRRCLREAINLVKG